MEPSRLCEIALSLSQVFRGSTNEYEKLNQPKDIVLGQVLQGKYHKYGDAQAVHLHITMSTFFLHRHK